jgi:hypothetical protein
MDVNAHLRARSRMNDKVEKARLSVTKAAKALDQAVAIYNKTHAKATKRNKLVPSKTRNALVKAIAKATEELTRRMTAQREAIEEHRAYFRPVGT